MEEFIKQVNTALEKYRHRVPKSGGGSVAGLLKQLSAIQPILAEVDR
ncbi:hypothetical protein ACLI09_04610 [Flavobacterium sp. RHBU_24]